MHITKIIDAYHDELPKIPDHLLFILNGTLKMNLNHTPSMRLTIVVTCLMIFLYSPSWILKKQKSSWTILLQHISLENLEAGLAQIRDGFALAAQGYEQIRKELPNLEPLEVPVPQLHDHTKPLQLLTHASEKDIVDQFIKQLTEEGYSLHAIKKAHGTKRLGGMQYLKKSTPSKQEKMKENQESTSSSP